MSFYYARKKFPLQYTFLLYGIGCRGTGREKDGGAWCKGDGGTRVGADSCTKSERSDLEKGAGTWCKGDGRTRARGDSCTKSERPDFEKDAGTWCKGDGRTRARGDSCTKSERPEGEKDGGTWCKRDGGTKAGGDSCTKSPFVANKKSQRNCSFPAIPFRILRIIPENAILVRNFVKIKGNDAK